MYNREHYGLDGFEWECPDCTKHACHSQDLYEFIDLAFRKICRGEKSEALWLIDEVYSKMGYVLPKEIIENLEGVKYESISI